VIHAEHCENIFKFVKATNRIQQTFFRTWCKSNRETNKNNRLGMIHLGSSLTTVFSVSSELC